MESEAAPSSVTVDEDGDLVLLVGAGTRILVSSKVLTVASKVFKAMLSRSAFMEGRELAESAAKNEPYELPLPDDDVEAMVILCQVIHHQARGIVVDPITIPLLEKLAIITDKYACAYAVGFASRPWLEQHNHDSAEDKLLAISYLLDHAEVFRCASRRVLMKSEGATIRAKVDPDNVLPDRLFDQLETRRSAANNTISRLIAEKFDAMQQGVLNLELKHGGYFFCRSSLNDHLYSYSQHDARRVQVFMKQMREEVKWPLGFYHCSLDCTFNSLRAIANSALIVAGGKDPANIFCRACKTTFQDEVRAIMAEAEILIEGLCLDCVQAPEGLGKDCRVRH